MSLKETSTVTSILTTFAISVTLGQRQSTPQAPAKQKTRKGQYEKLMEDEDADVEMDYVLPDNILGSDSDSI